MMKAILFALFLWGFVLQHATAGLAETGKTVCATAPGTSCKAFAFLEIEVTGGTCEGEASADCSAVSEATNAFNQAVNDWWSDEESFCDEGKAEAASEAIAEAIAVVFANAYVKVKCDGQGFACGWAVSGGHAWAIAFAEAIAQASAESFSNLPGAMGESFCFADIRALSTVISEAAADAAADACSTGETVEDFQHNFAEAIQRAIAQAFATAQASTCAGESASEAATKCTGNSTAAQDEVQNTAFGDACAGLSKISACKGEGNELCCDAEYKRGFCRCKECNGPWTRVTREEDAKDIRRTWRNKANEVCFCKW